MDDDRRDDAPAVPDPAGGAGSSRVRIIGAEPVGGPDDRNAQPEPPSGGDTGGGDAVGAADSGSSGWSSGLGLSGPAGATGAERGAANVDDDAAAWTAPPSEPELPHWTEAPTGEVPAILERDRGEGVDDGDPWAAVPAPTWREEHSDWEAHEDVFEPSMLASDDLTMSDRHDSLDEERQPWTFDLSSGSGAAASTGAAPPASDDTESLFSLDDPDDDTVMVPAIGATAAGEPVSSAAASTSPPDADSPAEEGESATAVIASSGVTGDVASSPADAPAGETVATATAAAAATEAGLARRRLDKGGTPDASATPLVLDEGQPDALEGDDPRVAGATGILPASLRNRFRRHRPGADDDMPGVPAAAAATATAATTVKPRPVPPAPAPVSSSGAAAFTPAAAGAAGAAGATAGGPQTESLIVRRTTTGLRPPTPPNAPVPPQVPGSTPGQTSAEGRRDLPIAVIVGVVLGIAVIISFDLGTVLAMCVVTAVALVATVEAYAAFRRAGQRPAVLLGWVAAVSLMIATYNKGFVALPLILVLTLLLTMLWYMAGVERGADPVQGTAVTMFVFCWIGVLGSYAALLLNPNLFPNRHGLALLIGAIIITAAYDIVALLVGSSIGSRSLAPNISPGKTWEGAIGGGVAAVLAGVIIVRFFHPYTPASAAVLGLVVAVVAPLGDLFESVVKRSLGLKDMGRILPGHGGILDRIDGLLFVLPATYYLVKAFHLG